MLSRGKSTTHQLVGGIPTHLNNMKVNWDDDIPNIMENNICSKPPTSQHFQQQPLSHFQKNVQKLKDLEAHGAPVPTFHISLEIDKL